MGDMVDKGWVNAPSYIRLTGQDKPDSDQEE